MGEGMKEENIQRIYEPPSKEEATRAAGSAEAQYQRKNEVLLEYARLKQTLGVINASIEKSESVISAYLDQFAPEDREVERAVLEANQ